jgi:hypothetical protein
MERFMVYLPRWLRWALLLVLSALVLGFSVVFFLGINRPGFKDWLPASVSVVQIALTALAYVLVVFFTESGQNPAALQRRTQQVLTVLLPQILARITDVQGAMVAVQVGAPSGVIGYDYTLRSRHATVRFWLGLNVHRAVVILFCERPAAQDGAAFCAQLEKCFADTVAGARAVGYDEPHYQLESLNGCEFVSIWLACSVRTEQDFLTHAPSQLFFAQDVAMMLQSFLRTAQRRELKLCTPLVPMPL